MTITSQITDTPPDRPTRDILGVVGYAYMIPPVDVPFFTMSHISIASSDGDSVDDDSLPSFFFRTPQKKKQMNEVASVQSTGGRSRNSLEQRRNRQRNENKKMLGMLESLADDESYVESTLASLEHSTNPTAAASLLKDIVNTTAPYHPIPQWKSAWKECVQWSKKLPAEPMLILPTTRQVLKYAPWMAIVVVYMTCRLAWYTPSQSAMTDIERITLNNYQDTVTSGSRLRGGLPTALHEQQLLHSNMYSPLLAMDKKDDASTLPILQVAKLADNEKPNDGDSTRPVTPGEEAKQQKTTSIPAASDSKFTRSSIPESPEDKNWIAFEERVQKLKDLSERGHISIASGSGPVSQFLSQQQQRNQEKVQMEEATPRDEGSLDNNYPALRQKQEHEQHVRHELASKEQPLVERNPQFQQPKEKDDKSDSEQKEIGIVRVASKHGENDIHPPGLISLDLV